MQMVVRFLLVTFLLYWHAFPGFAIHSSTLSDKCRIQIDYKSPFKTCVCEPLDGEKSVLIQCQGQPWTFVPNISTVFERDTLVRPKVAALSVNDGWLTTIGQDAFKDENIQLIDVSNNTIDSVNVNAFRGLENRLHELNLDKNALNTVPNWAFVYLHQLQHLHLRENKIVDIPPNVFGETQMKNLRYLHLDKNRISVLPRNALTSVSLHVLTLSSNRIVGLEQHSVPKTLWFLDLKNNVLTEIPYLALKDLRELKTLDLEGNNITFLVPNEEVKFENVEIDLLLSNNKIQKLELNAFDSFSVFGRLDLSYNQISKVNAKAFRSIKRINILDLSYNFISDIPELAFNTFAANLKILNLEDNRLEGPPSALRPLVALRRLNLNNNRIADLNSDVFVNFKANLSELSLAFNHLSRTPSALLQAMYQLRSLDLSKNRIQKIDKMSFGSFESSGMSLVKLNLAGNLIQEVSDPGAFLYLNSLTLLDLSFNRIKRLTRVALERLENLETLFLQNNDMIEFPRNALSSLNKLRYLLLDHNQILNLPNYAFQWLVHLERLSLSRNRIHTLNAKTFHSTSTIQLKSLNLGFNKIHIMHTSAFENLPNIEQLFLNNNRLTSLQPHIISSLRNLRYLTLAHNDINETQESAFANLPLLESLSLAHNRLRTMKEGIFRRVPNLSRLDLSHNQIESLDLDFLEESMHRLMYLDVSNNVLRRIEISAAKQSLVKLHAQNNQLEFVDSKMLRGFERLLSIDLSHNDLIEVDAGAFLRSRWLQRIILADNNLRTIWKGTFIDQTLIHHLDLSSNALSTLEPGVFGRDNVVALILSRNNFTSVPINAFSSIRRSLAVLDLSHNAIRGLEWRDFVGLVNVTTLILSHNRLEVLEEEVFREMPLLKHLDLSHNLIATWSPRVFMEISSGITHLNLAATGLFSLPRLNTHNLKELNVSHNRLYELYPIDVERLRQLATLDLSFNNLLDLKVSVFERLDELRHLNLSGNGLRILQADHLKSLDRLETLHLGNMEALVRVPEPNAFAILRNLKHFYIYNLPQVVDYDAKKILQHLPPLHSLHFEYKGARLTDAFLVNVDVRLLRRLTISGVNVHEIDPFAFERLRGFRIDLTIRNTSIRNFSAPIIRRMSGVSFLHLSLANNRLETLPPLFADVSSAPLLNRHGTILSELDLRGNPIVCDCRLGWLSDWIDYHSADGSAQWLAAKQILEDTRCAEPDPSQHAARTSVVKAERPSLLDIYDRSLQSAAAYPMSRQFTINGPPKGGIGGIQSMVCGPDGRLISGAVAHQSNKIIQFCCSLFAILYFSIHYGYSKYL